MIHDEGEDTAIVTVHSNKFDEIVNLRTRFQRSKMLEKKLSAKEVYNMLSSESLIETPKN